MNDKLTYKAQTRWLFHSHIKIKIPSYFDSFLFDILYEELENINERYNSYVEGSFFDKINKNAGSFVDVDSKTIQMLQRVKYLSSFFYGEYDITIMPLIRLWQFYIKEDRRLPTYSELENTIMLVDSNKIEVQGGKARIGLGQELITASFIKSYAVDVLLEKMKEMGISDAVVNAGGSTIAMLNNVIHPYWKIDVEHPDEGIEPLFRLKVSDMSYSTSSQSKTFVEIEGKRYGHIISPVTGYPSTNKHVGILTKDSMTGDIISTGVFNLSAGKFKDAVENLSEQFYVSGFMVDEVGKITFAGDFENYIM